MNAPVSKSPKAVERPNSWALGSPRRSPLQFFGYGYKAVNSNDGKAAHFALPFATLPLRRERPLRLCVSNRADFLFETLEPSLSSV